MLQQSLTFGQPPSGLKLLQTGVMGGRKVISGVRQNLASSGWVQIPCSVMATLLVAQIHSQQLGNSPVGGDLRTIQAELGCGAPGGRCLNRAQTRPQQVSERCLQSAWKAEVQCQCWVSSCTSRLPHPTSLDPWHLVQAAGPRPQLGHGSLSPFLAQLRSHFPC